MATSKKKRNLTDDRTYAGLMLEQTSTSTGTNVDFIEIFLDGSEVHQQDLSSSVNESQRVIR